MPQSLLEKKKKKSKKEADVPGAMQKILICSSSATVELYHFRTTNNIIVLVIFFWERISVPYLMHSANLGVCGSQSHELLDRSIWDKVAHNELLLEGCETFMVWHH